MSLALLAAFVVREATAAQPADAAAASSARATSSGANVVQALSVAGMFGMFFLGALYLQRVLGYDALEIGLAFLPATLVMGTLSLRYSERLIMRFGARSDADPGPRADRRRAGAVRAGRRSTAATWPTSCRRWCCSAPAPGSAFPALMTLAMSGATPSDAGLASGLVNTTAQVGGALGLAVLATLAGDAHRRPARRRRVRPPRR